MRSSGEDWSVVGFDADPTPGEVEAVEAWARDLGEQTEWLWHQSEAMRRTLTVLERGNAGNRPRGGEDRYPAAR